MASRRSPHCVKVAPDQAVLGCVAPAMSMVNDMKGIILAGGAGSRLHPITIGTSKQLLPVYDKPMIYYPLSTLMLAGIRETLVITTQEDAASFKRLLGDGSQWGLSLHYVEQPRPEGLAQAFTLGADFIGDDRVALVLGDNIFYGYRFSQTLIESVDMLDGCILFGYQVADPERYGVAELDNHGKLVGIEEKPSNPKSNLAITGLYFYDSDVVSFAKELEPSARGEYEITDINNRYLAAGRAKLVDLGRGFAWLDTGTHASLLEAGQFISVLQHRQGINVACLEEVALHKGFIDASACARLGEELGKSPYGKYVRMVARRALDGQP